MAKKKGAGRPEVYRPSFNSQVEKLCMLGATDQQIADFFGVKVLSIHYWKKKYPGFLASIRKGKDEADSNVAKSLYRRAIGYSHKEDVIFNDKGHPLIVPTTKHYPPDSTAMIFWLKNRRPKEWRDKHDHDIKSDGKAITLNVITIDEQAKKEVEKLK